MTLPQKLGATVVSAAILLVIAALSVVPTSQAEPDEALVRLSWRLQGVAVEECRTLTAEELAGIPAHMRRTEECTREIVDYELRVAGVPAGELVDTVSPSGVRRDRPVYVFRDLAVNPGTYDVEITFSALVPDDFAADGRPLTYSWGGRISLSPAEVALVTLNDSGEKLVRIPPGG
jgi:hypothetical protein